MAGAKVDRIGAVVALPGQLEPLCAVVHVEELTRGRAIAPQHDLLHAIGARVVHLADQGRDDVGALEVKVVARAVEVHRQQEDRVEPILLAIALRADEQRLLRDTVRGVRLLGVAVPEVFLPERHGGKLGVGADRARQDELVQAGDPGLLEHVDAHGQVGVPVAPRVGPVGPDAADLGCEVVDDLGACAGEQPLDVIGHRQVVVLAPRHEHLVPVRFEFRDEVRAEEACPASDDRPHRIGTVPPVGIQSTRPIQRSRWAAYQSMQRVTPSSHETSGSQPVSAWSFS